MANSGLTPQLLALAVAALACVGAGAQGLTDTEPNVQGQAGSATGPAAPAAPSPAGSGGAMTFDDVLDAFRPGQWSGNIGLFYNGERQKITSPSVSSSANFSYSRAWEAMTLRNDQFYWLDSGVFSGSAGITLGLSQNWQKFGIETEGQPFSVNESQHGTVAGYDLRLDALRAFPYNGTVYANRTQTYATQAFGGSYGATAQNAGLILRWGEDSILRELYPEWLPYFSASLEAYQRRLDQNTVSIGGNYRQNEITNGVTLDVRNGGETSDMNLLALYTDNNDQTYPVNTFRANDARLTYSRDFGADLSSNWYSLLDYYDRQGVLSYKSATVDERLLLSHTNDLSTTYRYLLYQQDTPAGNQLSQTGTVNLQHVLWRNLTTWAEGQAAYLQTPTGTAVQDYAEARFNYNRTLPQSGNGYLLLGGRYEYDSFNIASGQIAVIDEPHAAPPVFGVDTGFALAHTLVVPGTIVVVDVRGGSRLATSVNVDYRVVAQGDQTRIYVLPTSTVIQPGDPLVVSYAYNVGQNARLDQFNYTVGAGLTYDWFGIRYQHYAVNQTPLTPGAVPIIDNVREDDLSANLSASWESAKGNFNVLYKDYNSTKLAYKSQTYQAIGEYRPTPDLDIAFTGQWYRTNYSLPVEVDTAMTARLDVTWFAPSGWTANAYAYRGKLTSTQYIDDTVTLLGLKLTYNWRKITFTATMQGSRELRGNTRTDDKQVTLSLVRQI